MKIFFKEITKVGTIIDVELKERVKQASYLKVSRRFIAECNGVETAYICLDIFPNDTCLVLYELFIKTQKRRKGFGALILIEIERLAKKFQFKSVAVRPVPLSNEISEKKLVKWYKVNNYIEVPEDPGLLIKFL